jgi:PknH-like extracellular domain
MRRFTVGVTVAAAATLLVACGNDSKPASAPASSGGSATTTTTAAKPPLAQAALANLLLTPAEIDTLLGVTGTKSKEKVDKLQDDAAKQSPGGWKFPDECVFLLGPAEVPVYAGSGNTGISGDDDTTSMNNDQDVEVAQAVLLFPSAKEATDFFNTSVQRWPACANREFTTPESPNSNPEIKWKTGPFANTNGTLTASLGMSVAGDNNGPGITLNAGRSLTVRNNVVIDVAVIRKDDANAAPKVAGQIADKVDKQ